MKVNTFYKSKLTHFSFVVLASLIFSLMLAPQSGTAQEVKELSLADIVIGLRSNKVTLPERNDILAEAVKERGITFALTSEIQKELEQTGADQKLIQAIRQQKLMVKVASNSSPKPTPEATTEKTPEVEEVKPPDFSFYQAQANEYANKGELDQAITNYNISIELNSENAMAYINRGQVFYRKKEYDSAIADFTKAIELESDNPSSYANRGQAYERKQDYDSAIADYTKVIELNPKEITAYFSRSKSYEKSGNLPKAIEDFKRALELDKTNEFAKSNLKRLEDEQAGLLRLEEEKEAAIAAAAAAEKLKQKEKEAELAKQVPLKPDFINIGSINSNQAIEMVMPIYPSSAKNLNLNGKVTVEVSLDEEGNVTSAKATDGHKLLRSSCEQAALKSKFKPTLFNEEPIKAKGFIVYSFVQ